MNDPLKKRHAVATSEGVCVATLTEWARIHDIGRSQAARDMAALEGGGFIEIERRDVPLGAGYMWVYHIYPVSLFELGDAD